MEKRDLKAQVDFNVAELDDSELEEYLGQLLLEHCAALGLDPNPTAVAEFVAARFEDSAAGNAHDVTSPPQRAQITRRGPKMLKQNGSAFGVLSADIDRKRR